MKKERPSAVQCSRCPLSSLAYLLAFPSPFLVGEEKKKRAVSCSWILLPCPGPNPHLKRLSKELKVPQRSHAPSLRLTVTQQLKVFSFWKEKKEGKCPVQKLTLSSSFKNSTRWRRRVQRFRLLLLNVQGSLCVCVEHTDITSMFHIWTDGQTIYCSSVFLLTLNPPTKVHLELETTPSQPSVLA